MISLFMLFSKADDEITLAISRSNIPESCKLLWVAMTIKESSWHTNKRAIQQNNYSGFMANGSLVKFRNVEHYIQFTENWFKKCNIKTEKHLLNRIYSGKYTNQDKQKIREYVKDIFKIKYQISSYYNILVIVNTPSKYINYNVLDVPKVTINYYQPIQIKKMTEQEEIDELFKKAIYCHNRIDREMYLSKLSEKIKTLDNNESKEEYYNKFNEINKPVMYGKVLL